LVVVAVVALLQTVTVLQQVAALVEMEQTAVLQEQVQLVQLVDLQETGTQGLTLVVAAEAAAAEPS
jgi:hypothetical protein